MGMVRQSLGIRQLRTAQLREGGHGSEPGILPPCCQPPTVEPATALRCLASLFQWTRIYTSNVGRALLRLWPLRQTPRQVYLKGNICTMAAALPGRNEMLPESGAWFLNRIKPLSSVHTSFPVLGLSAYGQAQNSICPSPQQLSCHQGPQECGSRKAISCSPHSARTVHRMSSPGTDF